MVMESQGKLTDFGLLFIRLTRFNPLSVYSTFDNIMRTSQNVLFFLILVITIRFIDKLIFKQYMSVNVKLKGCGATSTSSNDLTDFSGKS